MVSNPDADKVSRWASPGAGEGHQLQQLHRCWNWWQFASFNVWASLQILGLDDNAERQESKEQRVHVAEEHRAGPRVKGAPISRGRILCTTPYQFSSSVKLIMFCLYISFTSGPDRGVPGLLLPVSGDSPVRNPWLFLNY